MNERLGLLSAEDLSRFTTTRKGETKLGERIRTVSRIDDLQKEIAPFVLLGIKEDIGIRANLGKGGATNCWDYALTALVNVQSNRFLSGDNLVALGALEFEDLLAEAEILNPAKTSDLHKLRELTAEVDKGVAIAVEKIVAQAKIPIIIGGGHNNAYGNIRGTSEALKKKLCVLNIDPHTDYRSREGRHSGNAFRYAREEGFMDRYGVYGLHECYNGENILEDCSSDSGLHFESFESILHQNEEERYRRFINLLNWFGERSLGLELDLDCLTRFPVSALNPSGFSLNEVRALVRTTASLKQPRYFHICEGSPVRASNELEREMLGKSIAYLVTDFMKAFG